MPLPRDLSLRRFLRGLFNGDWRQTLIKIGNLARRMMKTMGRDVAYRGDRQSGPPPAFLAAPAPPLGEINRRLLAALPAAPPRVAAVVPCYNYGRYAGQAVGSLLAQTYPNLEIVVVDDGSTDPATRQALAALASERVRVIRQENRGLPAARNTGARQTGGDYLIFLDADDTLEPVAITAMVYALEKNRDAAFVYPYQHYFGDCDLVLMTQEYNAYDLLWGNHPTVCALVRREAWARAGGYNEALRDGYEDWEFWIALAEQGLHGICLPAPLFNYRRHGATMAHSAGVKHRAICDEILKRHPAWYQPESVSALKRRWRPLVTAAMPAGAPPEPMRRTLASLAAQTMMDFELLLVGDGGSPAARLAGEILGERVEMRVIGAAAREDWRKAAEGAARGDLLCHLEGGEALAPTELETQAWQAMDARKHGQEREATATARRLVAREDSLSLPGSAGWEGETSLHRDPLARELRNRYAQDLTHIRHVSEPAKNWPNPLPSAAWQGGRPALMMLVQDSADPATWNSIRTVLRALPRERYHWSVVAQTASAPQTETELAGLADEFYRATGFLRAESTFDHFLNYLLASRNVALVFGDDSPAIARRMSDWRERYPELKQAGLAAEAGQTLEQRVERLLAKANATNRLRDLELDLMRPR